MTSKKFLLILEFIFLFIVVPFLVYMDLIPIPKIPILIALTGVCFLILMFDSKFDKSSLIKWNLKQSEFTRIMTKFLIGLTGMSLAVWYFDPESLFVFPRERFNIWILIMILYPLLSVLPQELVYRSFLFHRYKKVIPNEMIIVIASSISFAYLHIIYDNWVALGLTLAGGILFSYTYLRTRSLLAASLEHALYGCAIFSVGLGNYFYEPFQVA